MYRGKRSVLMIFMVSVLMLMGVIFPFRSVIASVEVASTNVIWVPDDYPTIQEAVDNASAGDTIFVRAGTYSEQVIINDKSSISIIGESAKNTIIKPSSAPQFCRTYYECMDGVIEIHDRGLKPTNINIKGFKIVPPDEPGIETGIWLHDVINCTISDNIIEGFGVEVASYEWKHLSSAIRLDGCSKTLFCENDLRNNCIAISMSAGGGGWKSVDNTFYHNNFVNSTDGQVIGFTKYSLIKGVRIYVGVQNNRWDNGFEGNFWDDYTGTDDNSDGVGDTSYFLYEGNVDNYPLTQSIGHTFEPNFPPLVNYMPYIILGIATATMITAVGLLYLKTRGKLH